MLEKQGTAIFQKSFQGDFPSPDCWISVDKQVTVWVGGLSGNGLSSLSVLPAPCRRCGMLSGSWLPEVFCSGNQPVDLQQFS